MLFVITVGHEADNSALPKQFFNYHGLLCDNQKILNKKQKVRFFDLLWKYPNPPQTIEYLGFRVIQGGP